MWSRGCVIAACAKSGHFDSQSVDADSEFHFAKSGECKSKLYTVFTSCPRAQQTFRHEHITGHSVAQDKGASRVKSHHTLSSWSLLCHVDAQHTLCSFSCTTLSLQRLIIQIHNDDHITHEESRHQGGAWPTGQQVMSPSSPTSSPTRIRSTRRSKIPATIWGSCAQTISPWSLPVLKVCRTRKQAGVPQLPQQAVFKCSVLTSTRKLEAVFDRESVETTIFNLLSKGKKRSSKRSAFVERQR